MHLSAFSVHLGATVWWCVSHDSLMEVLIAWALQAAGIIQRSKATQEELQSEERVIFFSVREISECYLTSRYPPILLNNVGHRLETAMCWFVIQTDKLNSSVQACLAGSLHDYVTLLQVHKSFLIFMMGFLILSQAYSLFFFFLLFFCNKKKKKETMTRTLGNEMFIAMHIR